MDSERWYFKDARGSQVLSTESGILAAIEKGELPPETLVWHPGSKDWEPAYEINEFRGLIPPPLPLVTAPGVASGKGSANSLRDGVSASRQYPSASRSLKGPRFWEAMFDPTVPIGRLHFAGYWVLAIAAHWAAWVLVLLMFRDSLVWQLLVVAFLWTMAMWVVQGVFAIKRLRDMEQSPWLVTLLLVPLINIGLMIVLLFRSGLIGGAQSGARMWSEPKRKNRLASYELPVGPNNLVWLLLPILSFLVVGLSVAVGWIPIILWVIVLLLLAAIPDFPVGSDKAMTKEEASGSPAVTWVP